MSVSARDRTKSSTTMMLESHASRKGVVRVSVEVTPEMRHLPEGDIVLRAYTNNKEIEVVFPNDRREAALQLVTRLRRAVERGKAKIRLEQKEPKPRELRQPLHVEGVWNVRLMEEQHGLPVRRFQLVAARWRYMGIDGLVHVDGVVPQT
ncbi:MAG: hypothetical protein AAFY06_01880 [Pseudomonadota bacterium]